MTEEILELWMLIIIGLVILPILLPVAAQKRKKSFTVVRSIRTHRTGEYRKRLGSKIEGISSIPPSSKEEESWLLHYLAGDALTLGMRHCANRRFFRTTRGYIGLGPRRMVLGDVVAVVYGGRVPLILRQTLDFYSLVGERCVHDPVEFEVALSCPVLIPCQLCSWHYGWRNHPSGTCRSAKAE